MTTAEEEDFIIAEHHFVTGSKSSTFTLELPETLKPYPLTVGKWKVRLLFLAATAGSEPLQATLSYAGFRIVSPFACCRNNVPFILAYFSKTDFESRENYVSFNEKASPITHNTDRLVFELQTLDGQKVKIGTEAGYWLLGLSLIQVRP